MLQMGYDDMPQALRDRLGPEAAVALVDLLHMTRQEWVKESIRVAGERFERRLSDEIGALRADVGAMQATVRLETRDLGAGLRQEMSTHRVEFLKWSFAFWVGQAAITAAIVGGMLAGR